MMTELFSIGQVIQALELTGGLVAPAAQKLGCSIQTVRNYIHRHEEIKAALQDIRAATLDLAEGTLLKAIGDGNLTAVIFFLKCQGKDRGYVEKIALTGNLNANVTNIKPSDVKKLTDAQLQDIADGRPPRAESGS